MILLDPVEAYLIYGLAETSHASGIIATLFGSMMMGLLVSPFSGVFCCWDGVGWLVIYIYIYFFFFFPTEMEMDVFFWKFYGFLLGISNFTPTVGTEP